MSIGLDWKVLRKITGRRWSQSISINNNKLKINGMSFKGQLKVTANIKQIKEIKTSSSGDVEWSG
ncbi:MAG: hypothetical protein KGV44_14415, partial [Flavobacteriaceae bacterium]|nr:hypothetical protein [Flavobacteriaceae bacterium]